MANKFIFCTNPVLQKDEKRSRQEQAANQQYKKCIFYCTLHWTDYHWLFSLYSTVQYYCINSTKVQTSRIGAISCAAEMPIQSLFLTFQLLPSFLTQSLLQQAAKEKGNVHINLPILWKWVISKSTRKAHCGLCIKLSDPVLRYIDLTEKLEIIVES